MGAEGRGNPLPSRFILSFPFLSFVLPLPSLLALTLILCRSFLFLYQPLISDTRLHLPDSPKISHKRAEELAPPLLPNALLFACTYFLAQPRCAERSIVQDASQPN